MTKEVNKPHEAPPLKLRWDAMANVEENERLLVICGRHGTHASHPAVTITVRDSGIGLKPGQIGQLFEAFYTTKPQGLGMGLAISRSIIEAHGGHLWAESKRRVGCDLRVLPACRSNASS